MERCRRIGKVGRDSVIFLSSLKVFQIYYNSVSKDVVWLGREGDSQGIQEKTNVIQDVRKGEQKRMVYP